jgi:hypothetical protein
MTFADYLQLGVMLVGSLAFVFGAWSVIGE